MDSRAAILDAFTRSCRSDPRVLAAFVGGSLATGREDAFSDLDLYAVIDTSAYEEFLAEHESFVHQFADPVFLEHVDSLGFDMLVFILRDGVQGELALGKPDHFLHIHGGPYRVLHDRDGLLDDVEFPWQSPTPEEQIEQLRRILNWFWRELSLLAVAFARGEMWTATGYLESARLRCVNLMRLEADFGSWADGLEKIESVVEKIELESLSCTFPPPKEAPIQEAVRYLATVFAQTGRRLAAVHGLAYPTSLEETVLGKLRSLVWDGGGDKAGSKL